MQTKRSTKRRQWDIGILVMLFGFFVCGNNMFAQTREIKGVVSDKYGPVAGASIVLKSNPKTGTSTDFDGKFSISVSSEETLIVSFIGCEDKLVPVGDQSFFEINLEQQNQLLEEVTVVAFGTQKKKSVVGSISTVKPANLRVPSNNLTTALGGRIAGLMSMQTSGEPGADNADFFVRGVATFNEYSRGPLILVDNMELSSNDLARISVDDIESFSILKDATSTALYGSRGANGVILVTTKGGQEGPTKLNVRFENSFSMPTQTVDFVNPVDYMKLNNEAIVTRHPYYNRRYTDEQIEGVRSGADPYYYPSNDWLDLLFKDFTTNQNLNLSLSGGGKKSRFYIAGSIKNDTGILKTDKKNNFNNNINIKNINLRSNVTIDFTPTTQGDIRINTNFRDAHGPMFSGNDMYRKVMYANPVDFPATYLPDEMNVDTKHILFGGTPEYAFINPYADMVRGYQESTQTNLVAQIELRQKLDFITEGLNIRGMISTTRESFYSLNRSYRPFFYTMTTYNPNTGYFKLDNFAPGDEALNFEGGDKNVMSTLYGEGSINYNRTFGKKHDVSALLVGTFREILTSDFGNDLQRSLPTRNLGLSGRLTYGYDDRYFIEGNFGYNGAERFAKKNRFGFFPSFGAGWLVSNEPWWIKNDVVTNLKLKATWGLVGNDAIGNIYDRFFYLSRVRKDKPLGNDFGENRGGPASNSYGIVVDRFPNPDITWEKAAKTNLGFELGLCNELELNFDWFTEERRDILVNRTGMPSTMGLTDVPVPEGQAPADVRANVGAAHSSGVEMALVYNHSFNKDMWITANGTFSYAKSRYTEYEETVPQGMWWMEKKGTYIGQQRGLIAERLFIDEEDIINSPKQTFDKVNDIPVMPGDIKYKDINEDGIIDNHDVVPIGYSGVPQIEGGFGVSFGCYGFDMNFFLMGATRVSFMIDPTSNGVAPFINNHACMQVWADNHWSETNRDPYAMWPRLSDTSRPNNEQASTWWLRDGSFLRLKSVELGYTLPRRWTDKIKMQNLRIYLSGLNLFTLSNFDLWDVEMGASGLNYPLQRVVNIGLNVNF